MKLFAEELGVVKNDEELAALREGGRCLAEILKEAGKRAIPGATSAELNDFAEKRIRDGGDEPVFLGYTPTGASRPFPAALCVSVNDEIVHGIPNEVPKVFKEGDIVGLDLGLRHKGLIVDASVTVSVGVIDSSAKRLIEATRGALAAGIGAARAGRRVGDIGHAIEEFVKPHGFGIVVELGGHGGGRRVHEEPQISNVGEKGTGPVLKEGMVIAIEPMLNEGSPHVKLETDGYTFKTVDGGRSAHFEHTILVTKGEAEIFTHLS